jgi:hypothetical protein
MVGGSIDSSRWGMNSHVKTKTHSNRYIKKLIQRGNNLECFLPFVWDKGVMTSNKSCGGFAELGSVT